MDAVQNALMLDGSELPGRQLKVLPKRRKVQSVCAEMNLLVTMPWIGMLRLCLLLCRAMHT